MTFRERVTRAKNGSGALPAVKFANGSMKREEIAGRLGVGVASGYRVLAERKAAAHKQLEALSP